MEKEKVTKTGKKVIDKSTKRASLIIETGSGKSFKLINILLTN